MWKFVGTSLHNKSIISWKVVTTEAIVIADHAIQSYFTTLWNPLTQEVKITCVNVLIFFLMVLLTNRIKSIRTQKTRFENGIIFIECKSYVF
jgi:hypothetical protein